MSDVMAVINVCGEQLVCVDYDRPVWHSKANRNLHATPNLSHFVVDGILATLSSKKLSSFGINKRFDSDDFEQETSVADLNAARQILYQAEDLNIEYFHDLEGDIQIHKDLARFRMPLGRTVKLSTQNLIELSK
jgi:hypothetical protein